MQKVKLYNLDAIISVGYRVNSKQATKFRIWATERLHEYIVKGFTMDDERLKNPQHIFGKDYFDEQLARIRDIRSSERRFYQKSPISMRNAALTMTRMPKKPSCSLPLFRTNYIGQSADRPPLKSLSAGLTARSRTWD
jgi:hypothetical protein